MEYKMSNRLDEGIIGKIVQKVLMMLISGKSRKAIQAFKKDPQMQRKLMNLKKSTEDFYTSLEKMKKADPKFAKDFDTLRNLR